jgi:hypothetical protein
VRRFNDALVDDGDLWQESVHAAGVLDAVGFAYFWRRQKK